LIPDKFLDIFDKKVVGHLATTRPDGALQNNPVIVMLVDGKLKISLTKTRKKYRNLIADPRCAISITDPDDSSRYLEVRGTISFEDDIDNAFVNSIANRHWGRDKYDGDPAGEVRVVSTVSIDHVSGR
jgi:PPOX class probable F420-dependent enzyme